MKIMICGKGGVGKTALAVLMARILSENFKVYIIDSDESNILLPTYMGVSPPKPLVEYVGGKRDEEEFERMKPDITRALAKAKEGIRLDLFRLFSFSVSCFALSFFPALTLNENLELSWKQISYIV